MKLRSVLTALLVSMSLAAVPACKKDKKKADDKAGETAPADKAGEKPAGDTTAGGEAKAEPAAATGGEAKAEPAAAGEPTEVKKDEAGGEKKEGGW